MEEGCGHCLKGTDRAPYLLHNHWCCSHSNNIRLGVNKGDRQMLTMKIGIFIMVFLLFFLSWSNG